MFDHLDKCRANDEDGCEQEEPVEVPVWLMRTGSQGVLSGTEFAVGMTESNAVGVRKWVQRLIDGMPNSVAAELLYVNHGYESAPDHTALPVRVPRFLADAVREASAATEKRSPSR